MLAVLDRSWGLCWRSWAALGAYVGRLGQYWGLCWRFWAALGALVKFYRFLIVQLGCMSQEGPQSAQKTIPNRKTNEEAHELDRPPTYNYVTTPTNYLLFM